MSEEEPQGEAGGFDARAFLERVTERPGVYRMENAAGEVIYVGKARNLKRRLSSYFRRKVDSPKTRAMVSHIANVEVTVTGSEAEALILENNLIKRYRPRYNVLLRDDKSYPYIYLSSQQRFPRLAFHRGARRAKGRYFGPYPSATAVRETLSLLQKLFPVRQCEDTFFNNRSRPCLQYQIQRCTAPCVGYVDEERYAEDVEHAVMFLEGKSNAVIDDLVSRMEKASTNLEFEAAARYRDQIAQLRKLQQRQSISGEGGDHDVVAVAAEGGMACIQVFVIRGGNNLGNRTWFPQHSDGAEPGEVLEAFLAQHYLDHAEGAQAIPPEILLAEEPPERELLEEAISEQAGRRVRLATRVRGERARWVELAGTNARTALESRLAARTNLLERFQSLQEGLDLPDLPRRIEGFDISHTRGEAPVGACVVFDHSGPVKDAYRRYNIRDVEPGDDYGALREVLTRRYTKMKQGEGELPDTILIDGGRGQVNVAEGVLEELQITGIPVIGIAKGPERKAGEETLFLSGREAGLILPPDSPGLHLIQQIDGEAHRFAIGGHRQRRAKSRNTSSLEDIPGVGPRKRQALLQQLGGLQGVTRAGVEELARVPGISSELAQRIFDTFHPGG
ncbi:Excinuclease ABC subunit C [Thiohalospira halophila DSM 15071]|uniref:UvrABC system protein C n=1 Tax=Thiohalospira halophila DSM 15071 TaxID=1123397 RepID=A0A1I1P8Q6_9GAMM|nr:excinuclease ABC subunit UvrC [Thiohalospira halophila]SFD02390.1 Excinuclease ABC subunit C [Thiohalospira halophila DSM 15071]